MNFLEQVASEWYAIQGYFVRTNVKANKRAKGGWDNELDVLAYDPKKRTLVHVETSSDALTWAERKERFLKRKFVFSNEQYANLVGAIPEHIVKRAVVGTSLAPAPEPYWNNEIEVITIPNFISEICDDIRGRHPMRDAIPENYPCLRSFQFVLAYDRK